MTAGDQGMQRHSAEKPPLYDLPLLALTEYLWLQHWLHGEHRCSSWPNGWAQPHVIKFHLLSGTTWQEWKTWAQNQNKYLNETCILPQLLLLFYLYCWDKHRIRLLFPSRKQKYFPSLIIFRFSATFIANTFLNHQMCVCLSPMLPLIGFKQTFFTTVKTNIYLHPLKHIWKRAVKNCSEEQIVKIVFTFLRTWFKCAFQKVRAVPGNDFKILQNALSKSMPPK